MKLNKLFMPLAVSLTALTPVTLMSTGCSKNKDQTDDNKTIKSGDSLGGYTYKLATVPANHKVTVKVINKSATQEQVCVYKPSAVTDGEDKHDTLDCLVSNDGTVTVPVGYYLAPAKSASSEFGLTFTYDDNGTTKTESVDGLTFNYNVDYDVDLKNGDYDATKIIKVADKTHWTQAGKTAGQIYMDDCYTTPAIYQSDARYSTSLNVKNAIDAQKIKNINSFRAYFNDIYKDEQGLNVHMNYEVKGANNSLFEFEKANDPAKPAEKTKYKFTNFDITFSLETDNGYQFAQKDNTNTFVVSDPLTQYGLTGRFDGTFDAEVTYYGQQPKTFTNVKYNDVIKNYDTNETEESFVAFMFAFGILHLTYDFEWATVIPELKIVSSYASNINK